MKNMDVSIMRFRFAPNYHAYTIGTFVNGKVSKDQMKLEKL